MIQKSVNLTKYKMKKKGLNFFEMGYILALLALKALVIKVIELLLLT